jgi:hypothetical protein
VPSRSPSAYEANPEEEKAKWAWMGNTDKFITVLKFVADNGKGFEVLSIGKLSISNSLMNVCDV